MFQNATSPSRNPYTGRAQQSQANPPRQRQGLVRIQWLLLASRVGGFPSRRPVLGYLTSSGDE